MSADTTKKPRWSASPQPDDAAATTPRLRLKSLYGAAARVPAPLASAGRPRYWRGALGVDSELTLRRELGQAHPLTKAVAAYRALRVGVSTTAVLLLLAMIAVAFAGRRGEPALIASASALLGFATASGIARAVTRERTTELVARGGRSSAPLVRLVASQLISESHRRVLANALELALCQANNLDKIPIAKRPPPTTKRLCQVAAELETTIAALRADAPINVLAAALCDRMTIGGYGSFLYTGDLGDLSELLARIHYLIPCSASPHAMECSGERRRTPS